MNKIWDRNIKVIIKSNHQTITLEKGDGDYHLDYNVEINRDISNGSNTATITIYNYSNDFIKKINLDSEVEISAGYGDDLSVVFKGLVEKAPTGEINKDNTVHKIYCNTYNDEYKDTIIDLKIKKNAKASQVIRTVLSKFKNVRLGKLNLTDDIQYKDGKTIHNNLKNTLKSIAKDTKSIFYISDGYVNFQNPQKMNTGTFELDKSYLLNVISNEEGYIIKSIFSGKIKEGMYYRALFNEEINDIHLTGDYPVVSVKHELSFKDNFHTEFKIEDPVSKKSNEKKIKVVVG